jgi:hypothetical protein
MKNDSFQNSSYLEHLQELSQLLTRERAAREGVASLRVCTCVPPVPSPLGLRGEPDSISVLENAIRPGLTPFAKEESARVRFVELPGHDSPNLPRHSTFTNLPESDGS